MFELQNDNQIIRNEGIFVFICTNIILIWLGYWYLSIIYFYFALSLVVSEEDYEEEMEMDEIIYQQFEKHQGLFKIDERLDETLIYDEILELLEMVREDPVLINKLKLVDDFKQNLNFLTIPKNDRFTYILTENLQEVYRLSNIKRFVNYKLTISNEFNERYKMAKENKSVVLLEMKKAKALTNVVNQYVVSSFIARGIYSISDYDFELFHYEDFYSICFFEFELIDKTDPKIFLTSSCNSNIVEFNKYKF